MKKLTDKETAIVLLYAEGFQPASIARKMENKPKTSTIKTHLKRAAQKLNLNSYTKFRLCPTFRGTDTQENTYYNRYIG